MLSMTDLGPYGRLEPSPSSNRTGSSKQNNVVCMVVWIASCLMLVPVVGTSTLCQALLVVVATVTVISVLVVLYYDALLVNIAAHTIQISPNLSSSVPSTIDIEQRRRCIVEELFPETVRDRLLNCCSHPPQLHRVDGATTKESQPSTSIVDLYPVSTVLFADLVGFTEWCTSRANPLDVCTVLETLYATFDQLLVLHHTIFKVETIGDAYLAIAGVPIPDPYHAQHVIQFALDMLDTSRRVLQAQDLVNAFDTSLLRIRIGIHSGPVAAGVLQGGTIKSRFQIFGDTVNTASRMESTSYPSAIQISHTVYDHLDQQRRQQPQLQPPASNNPFSPDHHRPLSFHIQRRLDTVYAKGKGFMTTYWVKKRYDEDETTTTIDNSWNDAHSMNSGVTSDVRNCIIAHVL